MAVQRHLVGMGPAGGGGGDGDAQAEAAAAATSAAAAAERRFASAASAPRSSSSSPAPQPDPLPQPQQQPGHDAGLVYARVAADSAPLEPGQPVVSVPLEVEPGALHGVLSTAVYSFREGPPLAAPGGEDAPPGPAPGGGSSEPPPALAPAGAWGAAASAQQGASAAAGEAPRGPAGPAPAGGPVGHAQLVGAVRDLLGAAGLPLDLERSELLGSVAELRATLRDAQRELQQVRVRARVWGGCRRRCLCSLWRAVGHVVRSGTCPGHPSCSRCARVS